MFLTRSKFCVFAFEPKNPGALSERHLRPGMTFLLSRAANCMGREDELTNLQDGKDHEARLLNIHRGLCVEIARKPRRRRRWSDCCVTVRLLSNRRVRCRFERLRSMSSKDMQN